MNTVQVAVDERLCLALHAAARAMDAAYRPLLDALDLTYPQYQVLSVLSQDGSQGFGDLSQRLALDSSTMSPLLKRLEARGLVTRRRDPVDERRVVVGLSSAGEVLAHDADGIAHHVGEATGLSAREQTELVSRLRALVAALDPTS